MNEIEILSYEPREKGKIRITFDTGVVCTLYRGEVRRLQLKEGIRISGEDYEKILTEILGKRAIKRAMHLLEKMERTESQLREKLEANEYPKQCIDGAIDYVKSFHYLDDERYAHTFVRFAKEKKSRQRIKQDLMRRGIAKNLIELAIEEEYDTQETGQIMELLRKRKFQYQQADQKEFQRTYGFLMRRGFRSSDILKCMKYQGDDFEVDF